jgi:hypothetical protein
LNIETIYSEFNSKKNSPEGQIKTKDNTTIFSLKGTNEKIDRVNSPPATAVGMYFNI